MTDAPGRRSRCRRGELLLKVPRVRFRSSLASAMRGQPGQRTHPASLRSERPNDAVLSEEAYDDLVRLESDRVWIIDPLDGTREFSTPGRDDWAFTSRCGSARPMASARSATRQCLCRARQHGVPQRHGDRWCCAARHSANVPDCGERHPAAGRAVSDAADAGHPAGGDRVGGCQAMALIDGDVDAYVHAGGQWEWDSAAPAGS